MKKLQTDLKFQIHEHHASTSLPKFTNQINPGHPVVSSVNCHTTNISNYTDYHLQPVLKQIPSYVKDTNDFIDKINDIGNIPPNTYLVIMDVKSLYINIASSEG